MENKSDLEILEDRAAYLQEKIDATIDLFFIYGYARELDDIKKKIDNWFSTDLGGAVPLWCDNEKYCGMQVCRKGVHCNRAIDLTGEDEVRLKENYEKSNNIQS